MTKSGFVVRYLVPIGAGHKVATSSPGWFSSRPCRYYLLCGMALVILVGSIAGILVAVLGSRSKSTVATVTVAKSYPHDVNAWTQGFEYSRGYFWESTGTYGHSSLRRVEVASGTVLQRFDFHGVTRVFGEGMTLVGDKEIIMVSWKNGRGFVFDQNSFKLIKQWEYQGEGWGLAYNEVSDDVWMSDGTPVIRVFDRTTLKVKHTVRVTRNGEEVGNINELEWVCDEIWANVWKSNNIVRINPKNGMVKGVVRADIVPLEKDVTPKDDVLNGIAFDKKTGRLWVTGKFWSKVYLVEVEGLGFDLSTCTS